MSDAVAVALLLKACGNVDADLYAPLAPCNGQAGCCLQQAPEGVLCRILRHLLPSHPLSNFPCSRPSRLAPGAGCGAM